MTNESPKKIDILVVVDAQNDFVDGALGSKEAVNTVPRIVEKIKNFDGLIYATKDTHGEDYLSTTEGKRLPVPHCIIGTKGHEINSDILKVLDEKICVSVAKNTFGSLVLWRHILNILSKLCDGCNEFDATVELVGFCTDICVISNALIGKACNPDINIVVDSSCCAGTSPEAHEKALDVMRNCQIEIT